MNYFVCTMLLTLVDHFLDSFPFLKFRFQPSSIHNFWWWNWVVHQVFHCLLHLPVGRTRLPTRRLVGFPPSSHLQLQSGRIWFDFRMVDFLIIKKEVPCDQVDPSSYIQWPWQIRHKDPSHPSWS